MIGNGSRYPTASAIEPAVVARIRDGVRGESRVLVESGRRFGVAISTGATSRLHRTGKFMRRDVGQPSLRANLFFARVAAGNANRMNDDAALDRVFGNRIHADRFVGICVIGRVTNENDVLLLVHPP